ncbi:MAG: methyltransferase domain-containing protein [Candidatus Omnitrophota bacterium]|nr:methyltransferase domain-containing protein [Candidatus Omnitrophota bacterium]
MANQTDDVLKPGQAPPAEIWDAMYANRVRVPWLPAEDVVRFCARHLQMQVGPTAYRRHRPCERILDLGCGNGRHVLYFARQGFRVSGVDCSKPVALAAMKEVKRVLKRGGLFHLNLRSPESFDFGKGEQIEPGTFILAEGPEQGLPQHFWTEQEIQEALRGFEVLNWELHVRWLDQAKSARDSRWAISAQWVNSDGEKGVR